MRTLTRLAITVSAAAVAAFGLAAPAQADGYSTLNAMQLEQTVLRAQMPTTLGAWSQNYYFTMKRQDANTQPTLCWNAQGDVRLPNAKVLGSVGYEVKGGSFGTVSVYQYANATAAKAALDAMKGASCSDSPVVTTDEGKKVEAQSGSDFTDASMTGYAAGLSYPQDGKIIFTDVRTTQRGLAIIQTEIMRAIDGTASMTTQQNTASKLSSVNGKWHSNAVKAYESFGQGNSR